MAKSHKTCMNQAEIIDTFGTYQRLVHRLRSTQLQRTTRLPALSLGSATSVARRAITLVSVPRTSIKSRMLHRTTQLTALSLGSATSVAWRAITLVSVPRTSIKSRTLHHVPEVTTTTTTTT